MSQKENINDSRNYYPLEQPYDDRILLSDNITIEELDSLINSPKVLSECIDPETGALILDVTPENFSSLVTTWHVRLPDPPDLTSIEDTLEKNEIVNKYIVLNLSREFEELKSVVNSNLSSKKTYTEIFSLISRYRYSSYEFVISCCRSKIADSKSSLGKFSFYELTQQQGEELRGVLNELRLNNVNREQYITGDYLKDAKITRLTVLRNFDSVEQTCRKKSKLYQCLTLGREYIPPRDMANYEVKMAAISEKIFNDDSHYPSHKDKLDEIKRRRKTTDLTRLINFRALQLEELNKDPSNWSVPKGF